MQFLIKKKKFKSQGVITAILTFSVSILSAFLTFNSKVHSWGEHVFMATDGTLVGAFIIHFNVCYFKMVVSMLLIVLTSIFVPGIGGNNEGRNARATEQYQPAFLQHLVQLRLHVHLDIFIKL